MTPTELLAELHRRGITVRATGDGHLRLTGASEAALTPALRRDVEAQRLELVALLAPEGSERTAPPGEGSSEVPDWLAWGGIAALVAVVVVYLIGRPSAAPPPEAPPPPVGWSYDGWQSWDV